MRRGYAFQGYYPGLRETSYDILAFHNKYFYTLYIMVENFLTKSVELFKGFPDDKIIEIIENSEVKNYDKNEAVIEYSEEGSFLGVLLEGTAELSVTDNLGNKHILNKLKKADIFGEISLVTGDRTIADVVCTSPCRVLVIPEDVFRNLITTQPDAVKYLSKAVEDQLETISYDYQRTGFLKESAEKDPDLFGLKLHTKRQLKLLISKIKDNSILIFFTDTHNQDNNSECIFINVGSDDSVFVFKSKKGEITNKTKISGFSQAFEMLVSQLVQSGFIDSIEDINSAGHIIPSGGNDFISPVLIDDKNFEKLKIFSGQENTGNQINSISSLRKLLPGIPHIAVFDSSFYHTIPSYTSLSLIKSNETEGFNIHGLVHSYCALKAAKHLKLPYNSLETAICCIDTVSTVCSVDHGRAVDFAKDVFTESFNLSISEKNADAGSYVDQLKIKSYCYALKKHIGSAKAVMDGLDVLVFTGDMNSSNIRSLVCQGLECLGIKLDKELNRKAEKAGSVFSISAEDSEVKVLFIKEREDIMAAREVLKTIKNRDISGRIDNKKAITIEVSAHHIHLSKKDLELLYGKDYKLTHDIELSQPGQYACKESVTLTGPKGSIKRVRILAPLRKETQVEIAMTEQYELGIQPPIRESGDLENTPGIIMETENNFLTINKGVICAMRHIHMTPEDALNFGLKDKDLVRVRVEGDRELIFGDVLIRVSPKYQLVMHIDTDEANAANIKSGTIGHIDSIQERR
jgi:acetate kinase